MNDATKAAADALDGIKPSAWQTKAKDSTTWIHCTEGVAGWMAGSPSEFSHYELRALYDRAAIERARADEQTRCERRVEDLTRRLRDVEARYMALLQSVADGVATQPRPIVLRVESAEQALAQLGAAQVSIDPEIARVLTPEAISEMLITDEDASPKTGGAST